ncbi:MAG: NAD(P)-dependent oxidoreductase [Vicinamibacterales bacterium]
MPLLPDTRVLLTGAGGQLAGAIADRLGGACALTALPRAALDVTSLQSVRAAIDEVRPEVVINCASYNDVDGAERDARTALEVNGLALAMLADAAQRTGARLLHFSTDFVFDPDTDPGPLDEAAPVRPRSVYAQSKLLGEILARRTPRHHVVRVESLFGGARPTSSLDRIAAALLAGGQVRAFADRTVSPSYVVDLAEATAALLARDVPPGLYHCVNSGSATWLEVIRTLAAGLGADPDAQVEPVPFDASAFPARRPKYAALSNAALAAHGVTMPTWQDAIRRYARSLTAKRA